MALSRQIKYMRSRANKFNREEQVTNRAVKVTGRKTTVNTKLSYDVKNALRIGDRKYISNVTVYSRTSKKYRGVEGLNWVRYEDYSYEPRSMGERTMQTGWFSQKTGTFAGEENLKKALKSLDTAVGVPHSSEESLVSLYEALPENSRYRASVAQELIEWDWENLFTEMYPSKTNQDSILAKTAGAEPELSTQAWKDARDILQYAHSQLESAQAFTQKMEAYKAKKRQ